MPTADDIRDEQTRMVQLRRLVDATCYDLRFGDLSLAEAFDLIERTRTQVLSYFPGKDDTFELLLRPRFVRMLSDRALEEWIHVPAN